MYYNKQAIKATVGHGSVTVKDFSAGINGNKDEENLSLGECAFSYNFNMQGGTLKDGNGVKKSDFGNSPVFSEAGVKPERLYFYKRYNKDAKAYDEYLLIYASDKEIYAAKSTEEQFKKVDGLYFYTPPYACSYNYMGDDVMIFSSDEKMKVYDGTTVTTVENVPSVTSMCIHSERLFATEGGTKTSLWFSDDFNPLNWKVSLDEAGFIDIREGVGSLLKAVSFKDYVYVFANYGIVRVSAYGDQTEFSVDGIAASSGKICADSIAVCGDRVIYLAEDGFYSFSGSSPQRIMRKIDGKIAGVDNSAAKGCYFNGNYYCKLKMQSDCGVRDVLIKYDIHRGAFAVSSELDINDFVVADGEKACELLFLINGKAQPAMLSDRAENFSVPLDKHWLSGKTDLGTTETKRVTRLSLRTLTEIYVTVKSERGSRILHFFGSNERQSRAVGLKGDLFTVSIDCRTPGATVSALKIEYEY